MGKVLSTITRPIKNYNIESRAHKIISKDKPTPAPKFKANVEEAERILRENPESLKALLKKDTKLDVHLKDVYVKSHDPLVDLKKPEPSAAADRPLPLDRKIVGQFEFGFHEPATIPMGRCTMKQAVKFITNHQEDSSVWNASRISKEYSIPEEKIRSILHYFRIYKVHMPDKTSKVLLAEPSIPRGKIGPNKRRKLPGGDNRPENFQK